MPNPIRIADQDKSSLCIEIAERRLVIQNSDITGIDADALVCPVDPSLDFRSGLARIVSQSAGKSIRTHRPMFPEPLGKVVVLPGGDLKVKYIFLTVILGEKDLHKMKFAIRQAVDRSIRYAEFLRLKSLAFPVLGCAKLQPSYNFIAKEMLEDISKYFQRRNTKLNAILFSIFNPNAFSAFRKEAENIFEL